MPEMCPRCRQIRNTKLTVSRRKLKTPDGRTKELKTTSYHCETCGAFIRSEEVEESAKGRPATTE